VLESRRQWKTPPGCSNGLLRKMSAGQIVEARSLAAAWKPKPELRQPSNGQPTQSRGRGCDS